MFEVGKKYRFKRIIDGEEVTMWGEIERYEHPLVKTADHQPPTIILRELGDGKISERAIEPKPGLIRGEIINVASPNFISAELED